jgi:hypothetical protein
MGRAKSKKLQDFMRGQEIRRLQAAALQEQITRDYIKTHSKIAWDNQNYPLTEKILVNNNPEDLKNILTNDPENPEPLFINPLDFPEGLVLGANIIDVIVP